LKGNPTSVAELKLKVEEIVNTRSNLQQQQQVNNKTKDLDSAYIIRLPVPNDRVGIIIGKLGMTVKNIQEKTRTTVLVTITT
jgi:predicted RNA-binding protein YlqC (UPF0109 family)